MGNGYTSQPAEGMAELVAIIQDARNRLRELEALDGTQIYNTVQDLKNLIDGLLNQVNGIFTGYVQAGTTISAGSDMTTQGFFWSPNAYNYDITYTRHQMWMGNDGRIAWASSSRSKKANIRDAEIDPLAVLAINVRAYNYRAEIAKRDDPDSPEYVGPDYHVAEELGTIAEELHELGLWQAVEYEDHVKPVGVHDHLLGHLAIRAVQHVWQQHQDLAARHDSLLSRVEALEKRLANQGL